MIEPQQFMQGSQLPEKAEGTVLSRDQQHQVFVVDAPPAVGQDRQDAVHEDFHFLLGGMDSLFIREDGHDEIIRGGFPAQKVGPLRDHFF